MIGYFQVLPAGLVHAQTEENALTFEIRSFLIESNTLLPEDEIQQVIRPFVGKTKTADDVEKAREALELHYREQGWGTVLVSIPQQSVESGIIRLQVIEGRIGRVKVTGNRYNTRGRILRDLKSLSPGSIPYIPDLQDELNRVNSSQDIEVVPFLMPGRDPGTIDVELRVNDRRPLHGGIGLNNRSTHDTTDLRLNASLSYDNLWQLGHSLGLQYQVSPEDTSEVEAISGSYLLNPFWQRDHFLTFYAVFSDSDVATLGANQTVGKGFIVGTRYIIPLPVYIDYNHTFTLGIDYKEFEEDFNPGDPDSFSTPVSYLPLSLNYGATLPSGNGLTQFRAAANLSLRTATDAEDFANKRFRARGNYIYLQGGVERTQPVPAQSTLFVQLDGQLADQPLISNEQYLAGGVESVRGYKESELAGDNAVHWALELRSPDLGLKLNIEKKTTFVVYGFYEGAWIDLIDPLPSEQGTQTIQGTGLGFRGLAWNRISYRFDWGLAMEDTDRTTAGTTRVYFDVAYEF